MGIPNWMPYVFNWYVFGIVFWVVAMFGLCRLCALSNGPGLCLCKKQAKEEKSGERDPVLCDKEWNNFGTPIEDLWIQDHMDVVKVLLPHLQGHMELVDDENERLIVVLCKKQIGHKSKQAPK